MLYGSCFDGCFESVARGYWEGVDVYVVGVDGGGFESGVGGFGQEGAGVERGEEVEG